jgi:putative hydrolase of the HAD superfamily
VGRPGSRRVLFDLGGVTARFFPDRRLDALARASGLSREEVHRRLFASGFDQDSDRGCYDLHHQWAEITAQLGVTWDLPHLTRLWADVFEPDPDVLAVIDQVSRTARIALLSNNGPLVHRVLREIFPEVAARFNQLCFSYQVGALKPDGRAFLATSERLGVRPGQCVFVDDAEQNVEGARAVGMDAFRFVSAPALAQELLQRGLV